MSFEGKNGKSSLKYQKFLEIFAIYGTPQGPEKTTPSVQISRQGTPLGSVFWYPLGHNPTTGYPARVLFYSPLLFIVRPLMSQFSWPKKITIFHDFHSKKPDASLFYNSTHLARN